MQAHQLFEWLASRDRLFRSLGFAFLFGSEATGHVPANPTLFVALGNMSSVVVCIPAGASTPG